MNRGTWDEGLLFGGLGVLAFSLTLPATRVAVQELDPTVVGLGRALVAAVLAALVLAARREPLPPRAAWGGLARVAAGVVVGFPLLSAMALTRLRSTEGALFAGIIPAATAVVAVWRTKERPTALFWAGAAAGLLAITLFGALQIRTLPLRSAVLLLAGVLCAAVGYCEAGILSRSLGGFRVTCWSLVLAAPVLVVPVGFAAARAGLHAGPEAWGAFAFAAVGSMFLGVFSWYRGLARGGVARISQLQLAQPLLTLVWSGLWLHERVQPAAGVCAVAVIASLFVTQRARAPGRPLTAR